MHPPSQLLLDFLELDPHAVTPGLPFDQEATPARFAADEGEAEEIEGFRFVSVITLFDGPPSRVFDGLPGTASRAL